jgi:hypothetical protein
MTEEQLIGDVARQIVQYARTVRRVAGSDWAEIDTHLDRYATEENDQRWAYGPQGSADILDPAERFRLSKPALRRALAGARVELGLGPHPRDT